jgi:hypothetical protein
MKSGNILKSYDDQICVSRCISTRYSRFKYCILTNSVSEHLGLNLLHQGTGDVAKSAPGVSVREVNKDFVDAHIAFEMANGAGHNVLRSTNWSGSLAPSLLCSSDTHIGGIDNRRQFYQNKAILGLLKAVAFGNFLPNLARDNTMQNYNIPSVDVGFLRLFGSNNVEKMSINLPPKEELVQLINYIDYGDCEEQMSAPDWYYSYFSARFRWNCDADRSQTKALAWMAPQTFTFIRVLMLAITAFVF